MALNKEIFKTPEDKLRAFDLYQKKMRDVDSTVSNCAANISTFTSTSC